METWEQRLADLRSLEVNGIGKLYTDLDIKSFIFQELEKAREEGREDSRIEVTELVEQKARQEGRLEALQEPFMKNLVNQERARILGLIEEMMPGIDFPYPVEECAMRVKTLEAIKEKLND